MKSMVKQKGKVVRRQMSKAAEEKAVALLRRAREAHPKELKVPISLRLDSDVYLELARHADRGFGNGKYQTYLVQILRHHLFGEAVPAAGSSKKKRVV